MRKQPKRILSLLLSLVLCLGLLPMTALADWTNEGDLEDVRIITDNKGATTSLKPGGNTGEGDLEDVRVITDNKGANAASGSGREEDDPKLESIVIITDSSEIPPKWIGDQLNPNYKEPGSQPVEEHTITFNANGGKFSDGSGSKSITTVSGRFTFTEVPTREGYAFEGWKTKSPSAPVWPPETFVDRNLYNDDQLFAVWKEQTASGGNTSEYLLTLDFNDGTGTIKTIKLNPPGNYSTAFMPAEELPTPTRKGYTFLGWFHHNDLPYRGNGFGGSETLTARWKKDGATEQTPARIDFFANGGRITQFNGKQIPALVSGRPPYTIDDNTGIDQNSGILWTATDEYGNLSSIPVAVRDGYTFDGWYKLTDTSNFWDKVDNNYSSEVFTNLSGQKLTTSTVNKDSAMYAAKWTKTGSSANGPFTVKFELYKNAKASEIPKEQTVQKGRTVSLPDGKKLTPPSASVEFGAWCLRGEDGKLYPWKQSNPVTEDMTLIAGWVEKGIVVKEGQPIDDAPTATTLPADTPTPGGTAGTVSVTIFGDVVKSSPFAPAISWAVDESITKGTSLTTFSPNNTCTRGQILTFLWRSQGSPEPKVVNPYKDEIPGAFQKAAVWAHEKGLVSGDTFGSADPCTRASSVTYMWKLAGSPESKAASFKDVAASSDYAKAVSWAVEQGVTNGTGDGTTFSPENTCTRGQIVTFLYRAYAGE